MKYILVAIAIAICGCGEESGETTEHSCEHYDELYSHTYVFCDGYGVENIQTSFVACNSRVPREQHREGCLDDYDLVDMDEGCFMHHVCYDELEPM